MIQSEDITNVQYQYNDIQTLFSTKLEQSCQQFLEHFSKPIYVLPSIDDSVESQFERTLQEERKAHTGERIILIPYHLDCFRWSGILIEFQVNEQIKRANYIDLGADTNGVPNKLQKQLAQVYPDNILQGKNFQEQSEQTNIVLLIIENLLLFANIKLSTATDNSKKENNTLLSTAHILREGTEYKLKEELSTGLAKFNFQYVDHRAGETIDTEERMQKFEDRGRKEQTEQEREFLQELNKLKECSDRLIQLISNTGVPLLNQESKTGELKQKLDNGLEKISSWNVDERLAEIKDTEKRIEILSKQNRKEKNQEESESVPKLNELTELSDRIIRVPSTTTEPLVKQSPLQHPLTTDIKALGEKNRKLAHLDVLRDEATAIPPCAEKTVIELLVYFKRNLVEGFTPSQNENSVISSLQELQDQLQRELSSEKKKVVLENLDNAIRNRNYLLILSILGELLQQIRPLNVKEVQRLVAKAKEAAGSISKKDIVLLVGETGSGKSTTIQFLAGSKMKKIQVEIAPGKFIDHITVDGPITNDELINVISSPLSKSETRYISPVTIQLSEVLGARETGSITLCDAPGFEDTAGPEVDIANSIGIIEAIKGSKSVKLLALSSYKSLGDRGQGIQKLAHILINMIDKIEDRLDPIIYAFTKYPEDTDINALLTNIKVSRENPDSSLQSDTIFTALLEDMIDKTEDETYKIDPLVQGDRKSLLKKLKNVQGIRNPGKVFRSSISKETEAAIFVHVQRDIQNINTAVELNDLSLILYYLDDLKILQDLVQQSLVGDAYEKSKRFVIEHINKYCGGIEQKFNRAFSSHDGLNENDVLEYKATVEYLEQAQKLKEHLESYLLSPETLIQNVLSELQKRTNILDKQDPHSLSVKVYLDSLRLLKKSFKELENKYNIVCEKYKKYFEDLVQSIREPISNNKFNDVAEIIGKISKCLPVFRDHLGEPVDRKYENAVQILIQHLISFSEKLDNIFLKRQFSKNDVKIVEQSIEILRSARDNVALQDQISTYVHLFKNKTDASVHHFKSLNEIYNDFITKIRKYFDQINVKVKELFEKNQDNVIDEVQKLIDEMDTIRTIPELESKTADIYYSIMHHMRDCVQLVIKNAKALLETIQRRPGKPNYRELARKLLCIKNTRWINRVSASIHETVMYRITEELVDYAQKLEYRLKKLDLTLKSSENINEADEIVQKIESMSVLEASVPELKKNWITINQQFLNPIQRVFSYIYETFNLPDKPMKRINQHLKQLEKDKREYDRLHLAYQYLQKQNYLDIDTLNRATEDLKTSNDLSTEIEDEEKHKIESQLNTLESVIKKYKSLEGNNMEANSYLKNEKYSSIDAVHEAVRKTKKSLDEAERSIENKRTKRINSISQRELIRKEYESILFKTDIDSFETVEETTVTCKSEKVEQKFDDTDMLDVSVANDALNYVSQCKKVNDRIVNELAIYTDAKLRKYIYEYGNFLNQRIGRKFSDVTSNDVDGSVTKYAQDLEMCLNELSCYSQFPSVSECIDGQKKVKKWQGKINHYYRNLCTKMEKYKYASNHLELGKHLVTAQALYFLDEFGENDLKRTEFEALYKQYQVELMKSCQEAYKNVLKCVLDSDYAKADAELSGIYIEIMEQKQLSVIQIELSRSLDILINATRKIASDFDVPLNKDDNRESRIETIIKNIEEIRMIWKRENLKQLLDEEINNRLKNCESVVVQILSEIISKKLTYAEVCLMKDNFYEAEQVMDNISCIQHELSDHDIQCSNVEKAEEIRTKLKNMVKEILKRNDFDDIKTYSMHPPRIFLANLKKATAHDCAKYNQAYTLMLEKIHRIFRQAIERTSNIPWSQRMVAVNSLNSTLQFLPEELQTPLQLEINRLLQLTTDEETTYKRELNQALRTAEEDDTAIVKLGELAEKYKTENIHDFFDRFCERIITRIHLCLLFLESCFEHEDIRLSVVIIKKIFKYKEAVGIHIQEIENICDNVDQLIVKHFLKCFHTLMIMFSMRETQITESTFTNITYFIDLFHMNNKNIEDILPENVLQSSRNEFQKIFEYLNQNSTKYQNAADTMDITELHKALTIAKQWEPLVQKIKEKWLHNHLLEALLENIPNVTSYADMVAYLETEINRLKTQLDVELISDETTRFEKQRDEFFRNLMKDINLFRQIQSKFNDIFPLKSDLEKIEDDLRKKVNTIINQLLYYAAKKDLVISDCDFFCIYYNHLLTFENYVRLPGIDTQQVLSQSKEKFFEKVTALRKEITASCWYPEEISIMLIKMKFLAENLLMFEKDINTEIDEALELHKVKCSRTGVMQLILVLEKSDIGLRLISGHSCLTAEDWRIRREKMQNQYCLKYILDELNEGDIDRTVLAQNYKTFKDEYDKLLNSSLRRVNSEIMKEPNLNVLIMQTKQLVERASFDAASVSWSRTFKDNIPYVLANIFAVWTLKNTQHYNQMRGIENERSYLLMPHVAQVIAIFRLLGIGYDTSWKVMGVRMHYMYRFSNIPSEHIMNNIVEIGTGEGKSVVLAILACLLALNGIDVYCSCYSEVLSTRDKNNFASVFQALGIEQHIQYGTFNQLCEHFLNEQCNVREKVHEMISTNKCSLPTVNKAKWVRPKILLIDEVDVFLSDKYYGGIYTPSVHLKDPLIKALLDAIWQKKTLRSLQSVKSLPEYQTCASQYNNWALLFDEAIKDLLSSLSSYQSSTYIVQNDKIVYVEGESIVDNIVRGYDTIWAYYHENEKGNISQKSLEANVGIIINCGTFSYAEMPHDFAYIVGVSGTLKTLSKKEKEILGKVYQINKTTYMPSVFGKSNRNYNSKNDVCVVEESKYFMRIRGEIDVMRNANRAILVFFESEEKLIAFYNSSELSSIRLDVQIITEKVSVKEREICIRRATTVGKVTLLTRIFGRGTDFVCWNPQLLDNGGIHVLQTFFSEELSEEYQIMGRGARQGDRGSYRMILLDKDLEWFLGSAWREDLLKITGATLYETLNKARCDRYVSRCSATELGIDQRKAEHKDSKEFLIALTIGNIEKVKAFLTKQNQGANVITASSRTILLMSATGSMSSLLSTAKETVCMVLECASVSLAKKRIPNGTFQLQLAVYRDYDCKEEGLLQSSSWETKPNNLRLFMEKISAKGGDKNDNAIEIGLWHAVQESEQSDGISQVILIGDAPAKDRMTIERDRQLSGGDAYWSRTKYKIPTHYLNELQKLNAKNIPVHTFYLHDNAKADFEKIARDTFGLCVDLDVRSPLGAELLYEVLVNEVFRKTADSQGSTIEESYKANYVKKSFTS